MAEAPTKNSTRAPIEKENLIKSTDEGPRFKKPRQDLKSTFSQLAITAIAPVQRDDDPHSNQDDNDDHHSNHDDKDDSYDHHSNYDNEDENDDHRSNYWDDNDDDKPRRNQDGYSADNEHRNGVLDDYEDYDNHELCPYVYADYYSGTWRD